MRGILRLALLGAFATGCTFMTGLEAPSITSVQIYLDRDTIALGDTMRVLAQGFSGDQWIWVEEVRRADWSVDKPGLVGIEARVNSGAASSVRVRALAPGTAVIIAVLNGVHARRRLVVRAD